MTNDTLIRRRGMEILLKNLGMVEAERFILLIQKEPFDYTQWQKDLFGDMSVEAISADASAHRKQTSEQQRRGS